jgi:hypothetical protein
MQVKTPCERRPLWSGAALVLPGGNMELQGRSWPNVLGGVSGLGRPAHIGAVVADLDGLAGAGQARRLRHTAQPCPGFTVGAFFCGGHGTFRKPLSRPFRPSTVRVGNAGGTRAAAVRLRGHFASLLHGDAVRCRHGWRAYLGRMIKDDSMGRFEVKLPLERRRQAARGSLPVCSPQASFGVARPSLWNVQTLARSGMGRRAAYPSAPSLSIKDESTV